MRAERALRRIPALLFSLLMAGLASAQPKAGACFFEADFEDGQFPAGWTNQQVERLDAEGNGTGELVPAWTIGTASDANAGGFFPVTDIPTGNAFIMANDDGPPCDCAMDDIGLVSPELDLSARTGVALECRVFHEQTLGGGPAHVEVSVNGGSWITMATIPAVAGDWQRLFVNLLAFDGQPSVRLRFRWSDGGVWASGFAVDDICLYERSAQDLAMTAVYAHDATVSPFTVGDQSLRYRLLPLEQAGPLNIAVELVNRGVLALEDISIQAIVRLDGEEQGTFSNDLGTTLFPGALRTAVIATGWIPPATGHVEIEVTAQSASGEDDPSDNTSTTDMHITGPGWEDGYGTMACDLGSAESEIGGGMPFIAAQRMELLQPGSVPKGISAVLSGASSVGEQVRAILMDANLAFVDTSTRLTLSELELAQIGLGEPLFFPFDEPTELEPGDYFVGLQRLEGTTGAVWVHTSGNGPVGASVLMQGATFDVTYLRSIPMVRLHLDDYGVRVEEMEHARTGPKVFPVPVTDRSVVAFTVDHEARFTLRIVDMAGRTVHQKELGRLMPGEQRMVIGASGIAPGSYVLQIQGEGPGQALPIIVAGAN